MTTLAITFKIPPQPAIRMTQKQVRLKHAKNLNTTLQRVKEKVSRYLNYKNTLIWLAKSEKFTLPASAFHIKFFIETKDKSRWGNPHQLTPDTDNLCKAIKDALCSNDSHIWDYRLTKYWCAPGEGRTEIWV